MLNFSILDHSVIEDLSTEEKLAALLANNNDYFLAVMGIFIILMHAGFAFLEAGSVRAKNTTNILIKNYADLCIGAILFWLIGYSFAFGEHNPFIGFDHFLLVNVPKSDYTFFFFQVSKQLLISTTYYLWMKWYFSCHQRKNNETSQLARNNFIFYAGLAKLSLAYI